MRTAKAMTETEQVHHLSENLINHLAKGREWATPGVQAAVQRAAAGLDTGIETASPRLQAVLYRLADELAGGVETLTPRVQERLKRVTPKTAAEVTDPVPVKAGMWATRKWWWIAGLLATVAAGIGVWRSMRTPSEEPISSSPAQGAGRADFEGDADLTAGRM
jgi:hypothetical protein